MLTIHQAKKEETGQNLGRIPKAYRLDFEGNEIENRSDVAVIINGKALRMTLSGKTDHDAPSFFIDKKTREYFGVNPGDTVNPVFVVVEP